PRWPVGPLDRRASSPCSPRPPGLRCRANAPAAMSPRYVHLHLHSEYSLTDSTIRIAELVKRCAKQGMPAVAITDQSNLFALVKFFKACLKAGVKPIAGADLWLALPDQPAARV